MRTVVSGLIFYWGGGGGEEKKKKKRGKLGCAGRHVSFRLCGCRKQGRVSQVHDYPSIHPFGRERKNAVCLSYFFSRMLHCAASVRPPLAAPLDKSGRRSVHVVSHWSARLFFFLLLLVCVQGFSFLLHLGHACGQAWDSVLSLFCSLLIGMQSELSLSLSLTKEGGGREGEPWVNRGLMRETPRYQGYKRSSNKK